MRVGVSIVQAGRLADPVAVQAAARAAEQVGYTSLWTVDRLDGLDPLGVLTLAGAVTERVRLGTCLMSPWYRPPLVARAVSTLDRLSDGRLTVALEGCAEETFDALDELPSRPPVLLAASAPSELERVSRRADGWSPVALDVEVLAPMWAAVREGAACHGRDPDALALVVRAVVHLSDKPLGDDRLSYWGTVDQIADDLLATRRAGADEVVLALHGDPTLDEALDGYARVAEALEALPAPS